MRFAQIKLPDPSDCDNHPYLQLDGCPIHTGTVLRVLVPGGRVKTELRDVRIEMNWDKTGPYCWYIAEPADLRDLCPVGLFAALTD